MKATDAAQVTTEVERKFDVGDSFALPSLDGLPGVTHVAEPHRYELKATYFDTADLRLLRNRMTLRRRTGGEDAGWHLKRPRRDGERDELRQPLGRSSRKVPPSLRAEAEARLRGAEVVPVVRLRTRRQVTRLRGQDGNVLAEVADDDVTADLPASGGQPAAVRHWREVEVELLDGPPDLLAAVGKRLRRSGARASDSPSKLARALGDRLAQGSGGRLLPGPAESRTSADLQKAPSTTLQAPHKTPLQAPLQVVPLQADRLKPGRAGAVVLDHLRELVGQLLQRDPQARADAVDGVHQMRVATRRLRSSLATFRPLFNREVTDPLRQELAWLGEELGAVRDAEVIRDHLLEDLGRQPAEVVIGPVRERVLATMQQRHADAHVQLLSELVSPRYFALLDALDALLAVPPWTDLARVRADGALLPMVERTWRRTERLVRAADNAPDAEQRDLLLHEVRKAAKRARYVGEALVGRYGRPAKAFAAAMKAVQEVLGDHQDSVVIRQEILQLAADAQQAGEPAFTYGRLHSREEQRGALAEADFVRRWERARRPSLRAWLH